MNTTFMTMDDLKKERRWLPKRSDSKAPNGKTDDPSTWCTYENALRKHGNAGAGIVVCDKKVLEGAGIPLHSALRDYQLIFIDIDVPEGKPFTQEQEDILEAYAGKTYIEKSQSGRGRHIYALCALDKLPTDQIKAGYRAKRGDLEMYVTSNRYAIVTGNQAENSHPQGHITDQTALVLATLNTYFKDKPSKHKQACATSSPLKAETDLSVVDLISRARRGPKGPLFSDLFDNGFDEGKHSFYQKHDCNFPSQSEADYWLITRLATLSNCNSKLIYDAFMQSQLAQREKAQKRDDYLERTIAKAVDFVRANLDQEEDERPPFVLDKLNNKGQPTGVETISTTKLAQYIRENAHYIFIKDAPTHSVTRYWYRDGYYQETPDDEIKGLIKSYIEAYDPNLLKMRDVNEVFYNLTTDLAFTSSNTLNSNENLINFQNGVLNIDTMELLPHSHEFRITRQIPTDWQPETALMDAPSFHNYMAYLCDGLEEWDWDKPFGGMSETGAARYKLLMQFLGVSISNVRGYRFKKALFMFGEGNTGKSQIKKFAEELVGEKNCCACNLRQLHSRFGTARIHGKRLIGSADMPYMTVDEMDIFKQVTGGDLISAEHKGKDGFEFVFDGVAWFCTNALPKFGGDQGSWVYERIMPFYCEYVVPPEKQNPSLLDDMLKEKPAIIVEAIGYLKEVRENNYRFSEPPECAEFRKQYQAENDTVTGWVRECCHIIAEVEAGIIEDEEELEDAKRDINEWRTNPGNRPTVDNMYTIYKEWCREFGNGYVVKRNDFCNRIAQQFGGVKRYNRGKIFTGICLKDEWNERYNIEKPIVY